MNLNDEQIDYLFSFVRKKYVRWEDVQYEIVDHLASAIEDEMGADNQLTFDQALRKVYGRFPITGFAQLVSEKERALHWYWAKKFFNFLLQYLKLPKILLAAALTYLLYIIMTEAGQVPFVVIYGFIFILMIGKNIYLYHEVFHNKDLHTRYLVTNTYMGFMGVSISVTLYPLWLLDDAFIKAHPTGVEAILIAIYLAVVLLWSHAEVFAFPKMLRDELRSKYQHLNIELSF